MVVREYDYIRGTTALAPERKIKSEENNKEQIKKKIENERKARANRKKRTTGIISIAMMVAVLGGASLGIDSYVYKIQNNLSKLEVSIKHEMDVNEAIKVDLMKFSSLDNINNVAQNQIKMVYPDKTSTITIDMSKEYFSHIKQEENNSNTNVIAKIFGSLN